MIADRMIVLVPLPDVALGGLAGAVGMLIAQAFVRAAFSRSGSDQTRHDYPLIIDELQVLIGNSDTSDMRPPSPVCARWASRRSTPIRRWRS